jgi:cation transport ATPase
LAWSLVRFNIALALGLKMLLAAGATGGVVTLMVAVLFGDMGAPIAVTLNAMRCPDEGVRGANLGRRCHNASALPLI